MNKTELINNIYRWRVRAALFCVLPVILFSHPIPSLLLVGIFVSLLGLLIRGWASCYILKEKELAVQGPYRYTRNPLYFGNFLLGISIAIGSNSPYIGILFGVYFLVFYPVAIIAEKKRMEQMFPKEYGKYRERVPLFFPKLRVTRSSGQERIRPSRYMDNKEYRALLGTAIFWAILTIKMFV